MTKIEWTDKTWNPIIGCSHISPACDHCYAEKMAFRLAHNPATSVYRDVVDVVDGKWNGLTQLVESALEKPLHWRKPRRVFVGSMTDLFHNDTPFKWIDKVFAVMAMTPHITYQILTKRPERMREYLASEHLVSRWFNSGHVLSKSGRTQKEQTNWYHLAWRVLRDEETVLPNLWLGVTVENQEQADKRIPILLDTPAAVRFVSIEPMLGPVNLARYLGYEWDCSCGWAGLNTDISCPKCYAHGDWGPIDDEERAQCPECKHIFYPNWDHNVCPECGQESVCGGCDDERSWWPTALDWVICGGETGPNARPMYKEWVHSLRDQCTESGTPFFFKKWGSFPHISKDKQRIMEGRTWEELPQKIGENSDDR